MIYFSLHDDPTLPAQNFIGATVDIDPDTVFVGQLQFTTGGALPNASLGGPTLYGYRNTSTSNSSAAGRSFNVINYVFKIPPSSLFGYNFQTSIYIQWKNVYFKGVHLKFEILKLWPKLVSQLAM